MHKLLNTSTARVFFSATATTTTRSTRTRLLTTAPSCSSSTSSFKANPNSRLTNPTSSSLHTPHLHRRTMDNTIDDDMASRLEDTALSSSSARGGGGRRGHGKGGRGRGGGGGRGGEGGRGRREVDLSRALSRLLRHQAGAAGVEVDGEGFARLEGVVSSFFFFLFLLFRFLFFVGWRGGRRMAVLS